MVALIVRRCGRLFIPAAALLTAACVTTEELAPVASGTPGDPALTEGRRIYLTCAGSCHSPEPLLKYTRDEWLGKHVPEMSVEAKLSPAQRAALEAYIRASCPR